jgi:hypothetical protein
MSAKVEYIDDGDEDFFDAILEGARKAVKQNEAKQLIAVMRKSLEELNKSDEPDTDET